MSLSSLKDGTGSGNEAKVDDHGRLYVVSNTVSHMSHHATYHKNSYSKLFETTLASSSETPVLYFNNNDSNTDSEIYWLNISANADVEVLVYYDETYTSGGTALSFMNNNRGSRNSPAVVSYEGGSSADLVLATATQIKADGFFLSANSTLKLEYEGGIVLPFGKSISIKVIGANTDKVKVHFGFAQHPEGKEL